MNHIMWLSTHQKRGNVPYVGPVTGLSYIVKPTGTPVHELDFEQMLGAFGPPCCGEESPPWATGVRLFYAHTATRRQVENEIPDWLLNFEMDYDEPVDMEFADFAWMPEEEEEEEEIPEEEEGDFLEEEYTADLYDGDEEDMEE